MESTSTSAERRNRTTWIDRLSAGAWHVGLQVAFWCGGGALVLNVAEPPPPDQAGSLQGQGLILAAALAGLAAGLAARRLLGRDRRRLLFATVVHAMVVLATLTVCERLVRAFIPEWPGRELHGVRASEWESGQTMWPDGPGPPGINDWGQRDRERTRTPLPGLFRIAFIGDSFLEEGTGAPVSLLVEQRLARDVEVVNLGVSATGPDEYFDRTRGVAIPLGARHCVQCIYAGNDFVSPPRTLVSCAGIVAVAPRASLLRYCGLEGINHILTNRRRPVLEAWFSAGGLASRERSLHEFLLRADDETARRALLGADALPTRDRERLAARLSEPEIDRFLHMLREPDAGRFRSHYLSSALWSASVGGGQWEANSPATALYWVRQTADYCRRTGVDFTVVIIPEGFQVDPRMVEQWAPLADMRHLTAPTRRAASEFLRLALETGCDVLDLHEALDGVRGAYLNLDGHFSATGAAVAADAVVEHLQARDSF